LSSNTMSILQSTSSPHRLLAPAVSLVGAVELHHQVCDGEVCSPYSILLTLQHYSLVVFSS
jgi:hypothetical protein